MSSRTETSRRAMLTCALGLILAGCSGAPEIQAIASDERGLKELADLYRDFTQKKKRGPKTLEELNVKGQRSPIAVEMINSGELIVQWGAPLSPEGATADTILAYVKTVPEQGGSVLMQDGRTIKKLTADEFKTAPKAGNR
jgi:hypothetical protein